MSSVGSDETASVTDEPRFVTSQSANQGDEGAIIRRTVLFFAIQPVIERYKGAI
jgi:hypothetical protein